MKYVIRAAPILVALALFVSFLVIQQPNTAKAAGVVGVPSLQDAGAIGSEAVTTTADALPYSTLERKVSVVVTDADLVATTTVTVKSTSDSTGITLSLGPVGAEFARLLLLSTTTSTTTPPTLKVKNGDVVTVNYTDADPAITTSASLTVETGSPSISNLLPEGGTITKATAQLLSVEVKDTVSGIDKGTIRFVFDTVATLTPSSTRITPSAFTTITDGFRTTFALGLPEGTKWIGAEVTDNAGNSTSFDADSDGAGDQGNKLIIDQTAPTITESYTGASYNVATDVLEFDKRNKVLVTFSDVTDLDGGTILNTDFDVEGSVVNDATFFDVTFSSSSVAKLGGAVVMRKAVVLTLAADLAPDKKPKVSIVGDGISDKAANALTIGAAGASKDAVDKISPKLAISSDLSSTLAGKDDKVQIDITSDETLASNPVVQLFNMTSTSTVKTVTATSVGTNSWRVTTDKNTSLTTAINVHVEGSDDDGNKGEVGLKGNADETADDVISYEADIALPAPTMTPLDKATPTERAPFFLVIDFAAEGSEYREDSHDTVTLTKVEVDGTDMLADAATIDNKKFLVAISDGLAIGEHTVKVNGKDEAGNVLASDTSVTFEVKERKPLKVALSPGWNLVSLPGNPADPSIDAVMANTPEATAVVTYDPTVPGGFLAAVRASGGTFAGTLKTMDATRGYWVLTDTFAPIEVDVPPLAAGSAGVLPPTIPIKAGWNLVPVLDVTGALSIGDMILASTYFATALGTGEITRVYWFDTVANAWVLVKLTGTGPASSVKVGAAYWVYTGKDANVVP